MYAALRSVFMVTTDLQNKIKGVYKVWQMKS